jgi:hypothetical protein
MRSFEAVWWNSRSRFKDCAMPSAIRCPKFNRKGTIVLRAVDRDLVSMVGTERTLIRTDGVAVFPLGDRRREIHSRTPSAKWL